MGARGYIARNLLTHFAARGIDAVALSSTECDLTDAVATVTRLAALPPAPYIVVFVAALTRSAADSRATYDANLRMVRNFVAALPRLDVRGVVFLSSADVYGRAPDLPVTETSATAPDGWYARSKLDAERILLAAQGPFRPVTILRLPGVYGGRGDRKSPVGRFLAQLRRNHRVVIDGTGETLRDLVYVGDLARIVEAMWRRPYEGVLNVATGRSVSVRSIAETLTDALGGGDIHVTGSASDRDFDLVFDNAKLRSVLGNWRFTSLADAIRVTLAESEPAE